MAARKRWSISAAWVFPGDGRAIPGGVMCGCGERIEHVGPRGDVPVEPSHRKLSRIAVLPGLVNAHTHLELSHLLGELPARRPMTQWLYGLLCRRVTGQRRLASVRKGVAQSLAAGTTAVADVSHENRAFKAIKPSPLRSLCLAEVMGIGPAEEGASGRLDRSVAGVRASGHIAFGVFPHAPYSTSEALYRKAVGIARQRGWLVGTHLAETEAERQFLKHGSGRFFDFLAHFGLVDSSVRAIGCSPVAFAQRVGMLDGPCLLAHVNCIDDEELRTLARSGASVAYCPGSNDFFGRTGHRYAEMLSAGINVALGTDSLASNTSLSVLEDMRRVRADGTVDNHTILAMGTIHGARALGWEAEIGTLAAGKQADWIAVELPEGTGDPLEAILTGKGRVVETVIAGKTAWTAPEEV